MAQNPESKKTPVPCDAGWNDPPMVNAAPPAGTQTTKRTALNKRVAFPLFGGQPLDARNVPGNSSPPKGAVATPPVQQSPPHPPVSPRARTPTAEAAALPRGARSNNPPPPGHPL